MSDLTLTLGKVVFQGFELPEKVSGLGGDQLLVTHQLPGGRRIIDAMGASDGLISWSGRFRGKQAVARAQAIDAMRLAGAQVALGFGPISRQVVVASFGYDFERYYELPYTITLMVVTADPSASLAPGVDQMIAADHATVQALGAKVGSTTLAGALSGLKSAISSAGTLVNATKATVATVLQPVKQAKGVVGSLIGGLEGTMTSFATLGNMLPGKPGVALINGLVSHNSVAGQVSRLYDLQAAANRIGANLSSIGAGGAQVVQAGGDLYRLAEKSYGDAAEWATIAKANGLNDPVISGVQTILVPPTSAGTQGLLQP